MSTEIESLAGGQCEAMVAERFPEGLVRTLERRFPDARAEDYEDAVAQGFERLLARQAAVENPHGYVTTVAVNAIRRALAKAAREWLLEDDPDEWPTDDEWADPTADAALDDALLQLLRSKVERWESRNVKTATLLILDAGRLGEPISGAELAEAMEGQLGIDVTADTARQWRKRGLDRLREELHADLETGKEAENHG